MLFWCKFSVKPCLWLKEILLNPNMNFKSTVAVFLLVVVVLMFATDSTNGFRKPPFNGSIFGKRTISYPGKVLFLLNLLDFSKFRILLDTSCLYLCLRIVQFSSKLYCYFPLLDISLKTPRVVLQMCIFFCKHYKTMVKKLF